jgi:predicted metalloprotease with PDZ domain
VKKLLFSIFLAIFVVANAFCDIHYKVRVNPAAKTFTVTMQLSQSKESETIRIPAWCPGFYFLLDYEKALFDFKATDPGGEVLKVRKIDPRGFLVSNPSKSPITVSYRIQGLDTGLGFFRTHVRSSSAFINGPSFFMFAEERLTEKCSVEFFLPNEWDIATSMDTNAKGVYSAPGYDELVDHPVQLGNFIRRKFKVQDIPFEAIWVADPKVRCDVDKETEYLRRASLPAIRMFGNVPFKKYTYIIHLEVGDFGGGLEHRASTVIAVPNSQSVNLDDLATHEYFHSWNVKQIRPKILGPFDYTQPQRTGNLWFSEGVTDYYAKLHAFQAGFWTESTLISKLENEISGVESSEMNPKITLEDVSRKTWENGGFGVGDISYYTKGLVVGLLMDAHLRGESKGKQSLDDLMRTLYDEHALPKPGFEEDGLLKLFVAMQPKDSESLYRTMVQSKNPLPYQLLQNIGLSLQQPGNFYVEPRYNLDENYVITSLNAASNPGLKVGDHVLSAKLTGEDKITVTFMREGQKSNTVVTGRKFRASVIKLKKNPFATEEQQSRFAEWLKGSSAK